ncbi:MAG: hypothetical protein AABZ02_03550 [Bacteroidota bacterium]
MPTEPKELTEARELLGKFEAEMHRSEGIIHLSEALSLLADVRAGAESERIAQIASNIGLTYVKKAQAEVEVLLTRAPSAHWETVDHWQKVFAEFERSGFTLPADAATARSRLLMKKTEREIDLMSPTERQQLLEKLQAMDRK